MKLTLLLSNLITEASRLEVVYDKYVKPNPKLSQPGKPPRGLMTFELLKNIIFGDPTTKVSENFDIESATIKDMEKVHIGKYVEWMLKNYVIPKLEFEVGTDDYKREAKEYRRLFIEDIDKLKLDLLKFERFKNKLPVDDRNIHRYTPETLYNAVEDFKLTKDTKSSKEEKITKENPFNYPGSKIDFVTPNWTVVKITDNNAEGKNAACYFGGYYDTRDEFDETNWCTSNVDGSYFGSYIKKGPLYVLLPNSSTEFGKKTGLPKDRYQFHFEDKQFMNRRDRQINLPDFFNGIGSELKEYFKDKFTKFPVDFNTIYDKVDRCTIRISQNRGRDTYVSIYGDDNDTIDFNGRIKDVFEGIKPSITQLSLYNDTNSDINIDIPDSLSRFENIHTLLFSKCVKTVPNTLCELKDLHHLAIVDCPNLVSIPDCVDKLNDLTFVNIGGSNPNVRIPKFLEDKADADEPGFYLVD
jgi:hypothetical protein